MKTPYPQIASLLIASIFAMTAANGATPILIFAGQSNIGGFASDTHQLSPAELAEQPNVLFYGDNGQTWQPVNLGTRPTQPINVSSGSGFGPEAIVGKDLVDAGVFPKVLEIKCLKNGSPSDSYIATPEEGVENKAPNPIMSSWAPDFKATGAQLSLYEFMLDRIKAAQAAYTAKTGEKTYVAGFFWMQGESDANSSPEIAKMYDQGLKRFILALRRDLDAPAMPFVFGRIAKTGNFPNVPLVRKAQDNVVKPDNAFFVPTTFEVDTDSYPLAGDKCHYTSAGVLTLGHDMAKGFQNISEEK
jgi:hypothetical protein